jgi:hypothetical protein
MEEERLRGQLHFELVFAQARVESASRTISSRGDELSYLIADLAAEQIAGLERAAQDHTPVSLVLGESAVVVLDLVSLERKGPRSFQIVGHVVNVQAKESQ